MWHTQFDRVSVLFRSTRQIRVQWCPIPYTHALCVSGRTGRNNVKARLNFLPFWLLGLLPADTGLRPRVPPPGCPRWTSWPASYPLTSSRKTLEFECGHKESHRFRTGDWKSGRNKLAIHQNVFSEIPNFLLYCTTKRPCEKPDQLTTDRRPHYILFSVRRITCLKQGAWNAGCASSVAHI